MPPALYLHQNQYLRSPRRSPASSGRSSSSSPEPPPNDDSPDSETSELGSKRRQSSESGAASQKNSDIDPESIEVLKRRSLPHVPQRSSSLTYPPETLQDDSPPSSPIEAKPSRSRGPGEASQPHRRGWLDWWSGLLTGRRLLPTTTPSDVISSDDGDDDISMGDGKSSDISESLDGTTIRIGEVPSDRYTTPFSNLWIFRQVPLWPPPIHPLVLGFRWIHEWTNCLDTPLDIGCQILGGASTFGSRPIKLSQDSEEVEEGSNVDDEGPETPNNSFESDSDNSQSPSHIEDAGPSTDPDEWQGIPVIEGIDPTTLHPGLDLELVGNQPPTPRPAHRSLPAASNTWDGSVQRLNETISTLRSQEFSRAKMLLDLHIKRRFGKSANAAPTTSMSGTNVIDGKESTISADGTVDVAAAVGEKILTIPDAIGGSVQDNLAATVQHVVDNLAQERSGSSDQVIISSETISKSASSSEAGETSQSAAEPVDADLGSNVEDLAPLERV